MSYGNTQATPARGKGGGNKPSETTTGDNDWSIDEVETAKPKSKKTENGDWSIEDAGK